MLRTDTTRNRVVAAIPTWREDAHAIAGALASCRPLDCSFRYLGGVGSRPNDRYASHTEMRQYGMMVAREQYGADWVLQLDADERLHQGERLVEILQAYPGWAYPIPLVQETGQVTWAPFKLIRSDCEIEYRMEYIRRDGILWVLTGYAPITLDDVPDGMPYIYHAPSIRKGDRSKDRLSTIEEVTDPSPPEATMYYPPSPGGTMSEGVYEVNEEGEQTSDLPYYCPACGLRYGSPGTCTGSAEGGHEATPVEKVKGDTKEVDLSDGTPDPKWTVAQIDAWAKNNDVDLSGASTKAEKLDAIKANG